MGPSSRNLLLYYNRVLNACNKLKLKLYDLYSLAPALRCFAAIFLQIVFVLQANYCLTLLEGYKRQAEFARSLSDLSGQSI